MTKTVLVTGASGFIGSHVATELDQRGYRVRAMTRHPEKYRGAGEAVAGDVSDRDSLVEALRDADAAYYLVHSLDEDDFEQRDAVAARNFATAGAHLERIVYLGGLGKGSDLSPHLRSRRAVEKILRTGSAPVTVLRAAVIIGAGGISWEITKALADRLPVLLTPDWAHTRTQPIALPDALRYLLGVLEPAEARGQTYDIGGPEVLRYVDMLQRAAAVRGKSLPSVPAPLVTTDMSAAVLALLTDFDSATVRNLIASMENEVIVHDDSIKALIPDGTLGYNDSVRLALAADQP